MCCFLLEHIFQQFLKAIGWPDLSILWARDIGGSDGRARAGLFNTGLPWSVSKMRTDARVPPPISITGSPQTSPPHFRIGPLFWTKCTVLLYDKCNCPEGLERYSELSEITDNVCVQHLCAKVHFCFALFGFLLARKRTDHLYQIVRASRIFKSVRSNRLEDLYSFSQGNILELSRPERCYPSDFCNWVG